jgi:hypothetical protein
MSSLVSINTQVLSYGYLLLPKGKAYRYMLININRLLLSAFAFYESWNWKRELDRTTNDILKASVSISQNVQYSQSQMLSISMCVKVETR